MANESIIMQRHSIRDFSDRQVDSDLLKAVFAEAQRAPSAMNKQPWRVYVATGEATKRIRQAHAKASDQGGTVLFNAPVLVYITVPKGSASLTYYDAGAFGYSVLLAAVDHGLSSIPAYQFVRFPEEVIKEFDLPANEELAMGLGLGYPAADAATGKTPRLPLDQILTVHE
ncbi:nitroreductase [Secundilactobacillus folii]|uniref:Nitroreductase n=1 Tax=Secundilactobacillus folii TaxID=2678357 RepID=A0A7X3C2S6_9LACO|nr:nitroreductase [Secundilactobacillus folii]MTV81841.1 nitroreductase [Secundilactobacillus folii]